MREQVTSADQKNSLADDERWQVVGRIAASPGFQKSARLRELLLYITEQTLHGRASQLTEHEIGRVVFGKPPDYSPLDDSSVRVHARQLRLRLHEYFDSFGRSERIIVEIPKGSYIPVFRSAVAETPVPVRSPRPPFPGARGLAVLCLGSCVPSWPRRAPTWRRAWPSTSGRRTRWLPCIRPGRCPSFLIPTISRTSLCPT